MRSADQQFKNVHFRLLEWGIWYVRSIIPACLNYPSQSAETRIGEGSRSTATYYAADNPYAEEIHRILAKMKAHYPEREQIIRYKYTEEGSDKEKIKKLGVASSTYFRLLELAKTWVEAEIK